MVPSMGAVACAGSPLATGGLTHGGRGRLGVTERLCIIMTNLTQRLLLHRLLENGFLSQPVRANLLLFG